MTIAIRAKWHVTFPFSFVQSTFTFLVGKRVSDALYDIYLYINSVLLIVLFKRGIQCIILSIKKQKLRPHAIE